MSIDEIAGVTRIPARSLEYLESGQFEKLPADVFVRGFLRSYARCVGLNADEAIRRYTRCGMTPAPVSTPLADELASSMATLDDRDCARAVRRVDAPSQRSEDAPGAEPGAATDIQDSLPEMRVARRSTERPAEVREQHERATPEPSPARSAASQGSGKRRNKRRHKRKQRPAADRHASGAPGRDQGAVALARGEADLARAPEPAPEPAVQVLPGGQQAQVIVLETAGTGREGMASHEGGSGHGKAEQRQARRAAHRQGTSRARTAGLRPVLVIDDDRPEDAERLQEERAERADASWRTFLPPALLDNEEGSHRGGLTLAVIILVIVATLTMSYLLRRPSGSGDGITHDMVTPVDGSLGARA